MNLGFSIFKFFPYGGLQRDLIRAVKEAINRGHNVSIFTLEWQGEKIPNAKIKIVPKKYISNYKNALYFSNYLKTVKYNYDKIIGFNRTDNIDFYFAGDNCLAERYSNKYFHKLLPRYKTFLQLEKVIFAKTSKTQIMFLTNKQKEEYQKHYHTQDTRFHLLPAGISKEYKYPNNPEAIKKETRKKLNIDENTNILIQVGSGFKTKGLDRSIKAFASLPEDMKKNSRLLVVGKDNAKNFIRLSKKLKVEKYIKFLGGRDDVPSLLTASDIMIHPAVNEATGTVLIEAMSRGLPVLCTEECGYSTFIVKANAGIVIKSPFSQQNLNNILLSLIQNKNYIKKMSNNAIEYSKKENFFCRAEKILDIIESN